VPYKSQLILQTLQKSTVHELYSLCELKKIFTKAYPAILEVWLKKEWKEWLYSKDIIFFFFFFFLTFDRLYLEAQIAKANN